MPETPPPTHEAAKAARILQAAIRELIKYSVTEDPIYYEIASTAMEEAWQHLVRHNWEEQLDVEDLERRKAEPGTPRNSVLEVLDEGDE